MKNLLSPLALGAEMTLNPDIVKAFKVIPTPFAEITAFLDANPQFSVTSIGKAIGLNPRRIYQWRWEQKQRVVLNKNKASGLDIVPKGASKKQARYTASEKLELLQRYRISKSAAKAELLRKYGLYQTDLDRWQEKVDLASLEALSQRKVRSDKKSPEQIKIEKLEKELRVQEKTTAKLSTLVLIQKKLKDFLEVEGSD